MLLLVVLATRDAQHQQAQRIAQLEQAVAQLQARPAGTPPAPAPAASSQIAPTSSDARPARGDESASAPAPTPAPSPAPVPVAPREPSRIGRLLAEHALSIAGGAFVLVAVVLFLTYAINAGWINEAMRVVLAALLAACLAGAAAKVARRLEPSERLGRSIGSLHGVLAGTACGVAILDVMVATRRYELLDPTTGFAAALVIGAATLQTARRWRSQDLAAFGMVVALAAPILVDAPPSGATLPLLALALVVALACAAVEHWPRLGVISVLVTAPQLLAWIDDPQRALGAAIGVTLGWWLLHQAAVLAPALADPRRALRGAVVGTCVASSFAVLAMAEVWMRAVDEEGLRPLLLGSFALVHLVLGLALLRRRRSELVAVAASTLSVAAALAAIAVISGADEAAVTAALVAEAVGVSALWWLARSRTALVVACALGIGAVGHLLVTSAPPEDLARSWEGWSAVLAALAVMVGALVARRIAQLDPIDSLLAPRNSNVADARERGEIELDAERERASGVSLARRILEACAWISGWYAGALAWVTLLTAERGDLVPQIASLAASTWTIVVVALLLVRASAAHARELVVIASIGAVTAPALLGRWITDDATITLLLAAAALELVIAAALTPARAFALRAGAWYLAASAVLLAAGDASPDRSFATAVRDAWPTLALLALLVGLCIAGVVLARRTSASAPADADAARFTRVFALAAVAAAFWLVSAAVVRAFTDPAGSVEQDAQVALSITWSLLGIALLVASLRVAAAAAWARAVRIAGYALLGVSAAKVLLVDTAQLETPYRMAVFLVVGILLLGAARLEQLLQVRDAD